MLTTKMPDEIIARHKDNNPPAEGKLSFNVN